MSFTVDSSMFQGLGYVELEWDNTGVSGDFYAWRLYRRQVGESSWGDYIYQTVVNTTDYIYLDWFTPANEETEWALVQVTQVLSVQTEGTYTTVSDTPASTDYWLLNVDDDTLNFKLQHVTDDSYGDNYEQATMQLIGRGNKVDQGTNFGVDGSLTADIRDQVDVTAKTQRLQIEAMKETQTSVYLRNPFGDVWQVALGKLTFSRTPGVGLREFGSMTIPYTEVS